jgi:hypothetical protein
MLQTINIDLEALKKNSLNEQWITDFSAQIKYLLWHMSSAPQFQSAFSNAKVIIKGSEGDLEKFTAAITGEKRYMDSYLKYGLNDPRVLRDRARLERAVYKFERDTGLKWPIK